MTPRGALRETLSRLYHRFTGQEAAALRYQRDAHAEEAGTERQRRMEAEREHDAAIVEASKWETSAMCEASRREEAEQEREAMRARHDLAVGYLHALVRAHSRDPVAVENALADAETWLQGQASGAAELEGSRGGLAWMPGEHGDEETLPSAAERS